MCDEIRLTLAEVRRRTPSAVPAWGPRGTTPRLTVRGTAAGAPPPPPPPLHCTALPCPALHCTALPCPSLPCPALPCPALPCPALHCPALPFPALPCRALHCPSLPCRALPCLALPCPQAGCLRFLRKWGSACDPTLFQRMYIRLCVCAGYMRGTCCPSCYLEPDCKRDVFPQGCLFTIRGNDSLPYIPSHCRTGNGPHLFISIPLCVQFTDHDTCTKVRTMQSTICDGASGRICGQAVAAASPPYP